MMSAKQLLSADLIASQTALELPRRETPATVVLNCLAVCVGSITISNVSVAVAAEICAIANVLGRIARLGTNLACSTGA